jgi:RNA polymerase sigma factor (sigma-70 family)
LPLDERFEVEDPAPRSDQEAPEPLRWDEVLPHFTVLTKREEEVLLLRLQSMKYREIAASLGIQTSSVNVLLARAIRKLRQVLSKYQAGNFPAGKGLARAPRRLQ